jgi:GNAT superfamily N-acetyltransferase
MSSAIAVRAFPTPCPTRRDRADSRLIATCEIDTDKARLDLAMIHAFLVDSHWAKGIPFETMCKAIEHSIAFGLYRNGRQIGFARVVTDHATFAYLADVFIVEGERNAGLGRHLVETILACPELQGLRRWLLGTRDAQSLYRRCGFAEPPRPFAFLERRTATGRDSAASR